MTVAARDEVFRQLVLARIIEPPSKLDSVRVLEEVGVRPMSYPTMNGRLPVYSTEGWRESLAAACAQHAGLGPETYVLYASRPLYFQTDAGDRFRESLTTGADLKRIPPSRSANLVTRRSRLTIWRVIAGFRRQV